MAAARFQQPLFSLFSQLNFLLFKICDNSQSLTVGFFLLAAAVALTDGHAPSPAITLDFTGNADPTVASFVFLYLVQSAFVFSFCVSTFVFN